MLTRPCLRPSSMSWLGCSQAPAPSTVVVREARDRPIELRYRGRLMRWTEIAPPAKPPHQGMRVDIRKPNCYK